jgi:hypothetical protein
MRSTLPLSGLSLSVCLLAVLASLLLLVGPMAQAQNGRPVLITQNVDDSKLVTLAGNTRPEANKQNDRGSVADGLSMEHMLLQLKRSPQQERALLQFIEKLQDRSSPNFHQWLTAKEYGERFGLATQDLDVITRWLESYGFKVNVVYENRTLIDFSGTAGQVQAAFHTEIHQLDVKGVKHIANMSDPRIPAALAPAIVGVVSLHDFRPHTNYKPRANYTDGTCEFGTCYLVVPADLATIYNLNPLFTASISGQGQTIVVVEDTDVFSTADWTTFRSTFGLSTYTDGSFTQIHPAPPTGTNNCTDPGVNGDDGEAILDAEYSSAAAPSAAIELVSCADTATFGGLIAIQNLLNESTTPPAIMSMSYGECEVFNGASSNAAFSLAFQQAVTEGVSVFVSSGDEGAASCDANEDNATHGIGVSGWASSPYDVAVGGTDFGDTYAGTNSTYWSATNNPSTYESALSYVPEIPWNDSCGSVLISFFLTGSTITYGSSGFCNSAEGAGGLTTASGSGGPSGCATGAPSVSGVVSGTCAGWPKPSWQTVLGNPGDGVRDLPDVSLFAANGIWDHFYIFCYSDVENGGTACTGAPDTWSGAGGTSFASPIMAGIQALVNQKVGGSQGNPNPLYYGLAVNEYGGSGSTACNSTLGKAVGSSCIFYDVTLGDMDVNCTGTHNCYLPSGTYGVLSTSDSAYDPAYGTTTGWDFATGIGTVNATNLVNNWPGAAFTFASTGPGSITVKAGQTTSTSYTFLATPTGAVFAGSVTLGCTFAPTDPTLTTSSCVFTPTNISAGAGPTSVSLVITTVGPNPDAGVRIRRRADNRSRYPSPWLPLALPLAGIVVVSLAGRKASKHSVAAGLGVSLILLGLLVACGGSSTPPPIVVSVSGTPTSLYPNDSADSWPSQTAQFTATVTNTTNTAVTWAVTTPGGGTITSAGLYTAPTISSQVPASVTITATSQADSTKVGMATESLLPATVPGTYTVTVIAAEGTTQETTTVGLVVQ